MIYGAESRQWQGHGTQPTFSSKHLPVQENPGDGAVAVMTFIKCHGEVGSRISVFRMQNSALQQACITQQLHWVIMFCREKGI